MDKPRKACAWGRLPMNSVNIWIYWTSSNVPRDKRPPEFFEAEVQLKKAGFTLTAPGERIMEFEPALASYSKHQGHWDLRLIKAGIQSWWFGWMFPNDFRSRPRTSWKAKFISGKGEGFDDLRWLYRPVDGQKFIYRLTPALLHRRTPAVIDFTIVGLRPSRWIVRITKAEKNGTTRYEIRPQKPEFPLLAAASIARQRKQAERQLFPGNPKTLITTECPKPIPWPAAIRGLVR